MRGKYLGDRAAPGEALGGVRAAVRATTIATPCHAPLSYRGSQQEGRLPRAGMYVLTSGQDEIFDATVDEEETAHGITLD